MTATATRPATRPANVVETTNSPHARLRSVPVSAVTLDDPVWAPRQRTNR